MREKSVEAIVEPADPVAATRRRTSRMIDAAIAAVFCLVISATGIGLMLSKAGMTFPDWIGVGQTYSYLEGRDYQVCPVPSVSGITSGEFQSELEDYLSDHAPNRDAIMLSTAWMQRLSIVPMAGILGLPAYPTFFGSSYAYLPEQDAIVSIEDRRARVANGIQDASAGLSLVIESHPQTRFFVYTPLRNNMLPCLPERLLSGQVTPQWLEENVYVPLEEAGARVVRPVTRDFDEYLQDYYRGDFHYNALGANRGYCAVMEAMGHGEDILERNQLLREPVVSIGADERTALQFLSEPDYLTDYEYDLPRYSVYIDGEPQDPSFVRHRELLETEDYDSDIYIARLSEYFRGGIRGSVMLLVNEDMPDASADASSDASSSSVSSDVSAVRDDGEVLIIVDDSFGKGVEYLYLSHYKYVYVLDPRGFPMTLGEAVDAYHADDVLILTSVSVLADNTDILAN